MFWAGINEIDEAGSAVEFSEEESSIGLRFGGFDPLKARLDGTVIAAALSEDSAAIAAHPHGDTEIDCKVKKAEQKQGELRRRRRRSVLENEMQRRNIYK